MGIYDTSLATIDMGIYDTSLATIGGTRCYCFDNLSICENFLWHFEILIWKSMEKFENVQNLEDGW